VYGVPGMHLRTEFNVDVFVLSLQSEFNMGVAN
jgi:hypothetical protein